MAITKVVHSRTNNRRFLVRIVTAGDTYGLRDCLLYTNPKPMVEYYDFTYAGESFGPRGQFVSRYYLETLSEGTRNNGLCLHGGEPQAWTLDAEAFADSLVLAGYGADIIHPNAHPNPKPCNIG